MLFLFQFLALFQIIQENWKHVFIFRPETFQNIQICIFCFPDVLLKECLKDDWQNAAPLRKNLQGNAPPNDFEELQVVGLGRAPVWLEGLAICPTQKLRIISVKNHGVLYGGLRG